MPSVIMQTSDPKTTKKCCCKEDVVQSIELEHFNKQEGRKVKNTTARREFRRSAAPSPSPTRTGNRMRDDEKKRKGNLDGNKKKG